MYAKILVPLDGSEVAEQALGPALALARPAQAEIFGLCVATSAHMDEQTFGSYGFWFPEGSASQSRQELTAYQTQIQEKIEQPDITLRLELREGDAAGVIVDTAVAEAADLIVMTTHGYTGFTRWLLGSVTEKVLQSAPCPVLVLRQAKPIYQVLIPIDGSALSEAAIEPGLEIARRLEGEVTLLSVAETGKHEHHTASEPDRAPPTNEQHQADSYLATTQQRYQPLFAGEIKTVCRQGAPADTILDFIDSEHVDLVAMATHGRSGLKRWLYGSVTKKVLDNASCALLIVRPPLLTQ